MTRPGRRCRFARPVYDVSLLFDRNSDYPGMHHAERSGSAQRYIDHPSPNEWPTIIDATAYGVASVGNRHDASESPAAMSAGHLAVATASAIVRSKAGLGFRGGSGAQHKRKSQYGPIHRTIHPTTSGLTRIRFG